MTDAEIIKALECCCDTKEIVCTDKCPLYDCDCDCWSVMKHDVLDLINRQKAEIERLNKEISISQHLLSDAWRNIEIQDKFYKTARADAIKEFVKRLKGTDGYNNHIFDACASVIVPDEYKKGRYEKTKEVWELIDNLVKEMVGDT